MNELILALMVWLAPHMAVTPAELGTLPVPEVTYHTQEELYRAHNATMTYLGEDSPHKVMGLYQFPDEFMVEHGFDPEDVISQSVLLHEMVHHFQAHSTTRAYECDAARDREAYLIQEMFLKERGHDLFTNEGERPTYGLEVLFFVGITNCPQPNLAKPWEAGP